LLCPVGGNPNARNDAIALFVENPLYADADLTEVLAFDVTELMGIWEARPISLFDCLVPSCRAPITVRNRTHLRQLLRLDWYFGLKVGAGDLVEFKSLSEMLCENCGQELQQCHDEERRTDLSVRRSRIAELHQMTYAEYLRTPEWKARRSRVLTRAGHRCELCNASGRLEVHHRTYERYAQEMLQDLIALCSICHKNFHGILPKAA
jgi:5-methylcytosine-specific restriction endonuclease McrA